MKRNAFEKVLIGEIAKVKGGKRLPKGHAFLDEQTAHPYIRGQDIRGGRVNISKPMFISDATAAKLTRYTVNAGDICVTIVGNIGDVAMIPRSLEGANLTENAAKLSALSSAFDPTFVMYALLEPDAQLQMKNLAAGAAQPKLGFYKLEAVEVPVASLPTQRKIASILSAYDDLIENNTRRIAILEEMAQAIYREWFVNFRFPGHENAKLVDSPLGQIPEGWEPTTVGDLAVNERRSVNPQEVDPETPYVGLEHIPRKSITLSDWGLASEIESTKHRFCQGEILFGKIRPYFHKVIVAPFDGICSSDAIVIVPRKDAYFPAVLCCVSSVPFVDHATQTSQGTKMPRANWDILTKYPLPLPPADLLGRFNEVVTDIVSTLKTLMLKNHNLRTTRDLLLPKLISGKLDVEDLDIDTGLTAETLEEVTL